MNTFCALRDWLQKPVRCQSFFLMTKKEKKINYLKLERVVARVAILYGEPLPRR